MSRVLYAAPVTCNMSVLSESCSLWPPCYLEERSLTLFGAVRLRAVLAVLCTVCAVQNRAESSSALSITKLSQAQHCPEQSWVKLSAVQNRAESSSALSRTKLSQAQHCPKQSWVKLSAVRYRAECSRSVLSGTGLDAKSHTFVMTVCFPGLCRHIYHQKLYFR